MPIAVVLAVVRPLNSSVPALCQLDVVPAVVGCDLRFDMKPVTYSPPRVLREWLPVVRQQFL